MVTQYERRGAASAPARGGRRSLLAPALALLLAWPGAAAAQVITTVAGGGYPDGQLAVTAPLGGPGHVAADAAGNIYVAASGLHRVVKIDAAGVITTVAGNGFAGFSGDGGAATAASLNFPYAVAVDAAGNLLIADANNNRIRRVAASTGVITTVAGNGTGGFSGDGGAATAASLSSPRDVAVDAAGNLLIVDQGNNRIRRVEASTGVIITVAGNGSPGFSGDGGTATAASLNIPGSAAVDTAGNLLIADTLNRRIRRVAASTGIITTVAGNGASGFSGDGGPATAASFSLPYGVAVDAAGNLLIADTGNQRIRRVAASTGIITTVAGNGTGGFAGDGGAATAASLSGPAGVALDAAGNLLIADGGSHQIRRVAAATGIITTVAGNGTPGFSGDGGAATAARLNTPIGVAVDAAGNLFIAESNNQRVRRVAASTGVITTVAGNGSSAFSGDGGAATAAGLSVPPGVAVDAAGNLLIADAGHHRIRRVAASTGVITTVAGNGTAGFSGDGGAATAASLNVPSDVAIDGMGNLLIADRNNHRIRQVAAGTGVITTVAGNGVGGFSGDGGAATAARLFFPYGVSVDAAGNLLIADESTQRIRRVAASTGVITTVAGNGIAGFSGDGGVATAASLHNPDRVAVDAAGHLWIADSDNHRVRRVVAFSDTTCDGLDDDLDGSIDEDYVSQPTTCGVGACGATGSTSCVAGTVQNSCTPGTPAPSDITCNGVDDNCNGAVDEGYVSQPTTCGIGACSATGATSCVAGAVQNSCTPGTPAASDTTCNGIDDNCNGTVDEGYVSQSTSCGAGACASTGVTSCVAGAVQNSCNVAATNGQSCDDGSVCTTGDACSSGVCQSGAPVAVDDANPCTDDSCDAQAGVLHVPNSAPCNDGSACTTADACSAGACSGTPVDPDDGDACTLDTCDAGTGVSHTPIDTDGDGTPNCSDACPFDTAKIDPGVCGCGASDADGDGDGTADCLDGCPADAAKTAPGQCGCLVADTDGDSDGTADCVDGCPADPAKIAPQICGCGAADADTDGDAALDCQDACPSDPNKQASAGACGCGVADADTDGDGTLDCQEGCPADAGKTQPGQCGCGVADTDADGDGTADCVDACPADPAKIAPQVCGCGVADVDADGDATPDCVDGCASDPNKLAAGVCGCGVSDADADLDGVPDCNDGCPTDAGKLTAGICGCGVSDRDTDGDGTIDCQELCDTDPAKVAPGLCGCGVIDNANDSDEDGTIDCLDACPVDETKTVPGACGCNRPEVPGCPRPACSNELDDDGDGYTDLADPGCGNAFAETEDPACQNGADDDGDGRIDFDGGASRNGGVPISIPDPGCFVPSRPTEAGPGCGLGAELALVFAALRLARRSMR